MNKLLFVLVALAASCRRESPSASTPGASSSTPGVIPPIAAKPGEQWTLTFDKSILDFAYGPGELAVVAARDEVAELRIVDERTGKTRSVLDDTSKDHGTIYSPAYSPSGNQLAYMRKVADMPNEDVDLVVVDLASGKKQRAHLGRATFMTAELWFTPDGRGLFIVYDLYRIGYFALGDEIRQRGTADIFDGVPYHYEPQMTPSGTMAVHDGKGRIVTLDSSMHRTEQHVDGVETVFRVDPLLYADTNHHLWSLDGTTPRDLGETKAIRRITAIGNDALVLSGTDKRTVMTFDRISTASATPVSSVPAEFGDEFLLPINELDPHHLRTDHKGFAWADYKDMKELRFIALP